MGISYNPSIVTEGLVLALDPQSPRFYNYKGRSVAFVKSDNDGFTISNSTGWFNPNNTSQWTLEGWILNPSSTNSFSIYSGTWGSIANFGCAIGGGVAFQSGNGAWAWVTNSTIVADTGSPTGWNHFAFTKNGSTFEVFLNGSRIYTGTPTFGTGTTGGSIHLQSYFSNPIYYSDAAGLSNVRYVTGSVLYSGTSYTVPTEPLTAISGTQLLVYQDTTFTDASSNSLTLTKQNSPTISYDGPFSGSGWTDLTNNGNSGTLTNGPVFIPGGPFNNSGGSVSVTDAGNSYLSAGGESEDYNFGTGDFTIEGYFYVNSSGSNNCVFDLRSGQSHYLMRMTSSTAYDFRYGGSSLVTFTAADKVWNHIAISRASGTTKIFVNGIQTNSFADTNNASNSGPLLISTFVDTTGSSSSYGFDGFVSNFHIVKGTALYTSNFTPPTGPLEAVDDTVLLTCQGGAITDNGPSSHAITVNNDAKAVTASAFEFDGTDDYVTAPNNADFDFGSGDFTVEYWINFSTVSGIRGIFGKRVSEVNYAPILMYLQSSALQLQMSTSGSSWNVSLSTSTLSTGSWNHVAVFRSGTTVYLFLNGTSIGSTGTVSGALISNTAPLTVGVDSTSPSGSTPLNGYISNFRIYKGKALTEDEVKRNFSALRGRYGI